jgi:hypothetical protein
MSFNPSTHEQLNQLSESSLRVVMAVIVMLEQGQTEAVSQLIQALEAVK